MVTRKGIRLLLILFIVAIVLVTAGCTPKYAISILVSPEGAGTISPKSGNYDIGSQLTLEADPAWYYLFDHWSGDITGTSSSVTLTMDSDKSVTAHFKMFFSSIFKSMFKEVPYHEGVPQAADYQGDEHPLVLLDWNGGVHDWSDDVPIEWLPTSVEETQLVVCVGEQEENQVGAVCYYGAVTPSTAVRRYQYSVYVKLIEAKTGEVVARATLWGSLPVECPPFQSIMKGKTKILGSLVTFEQVKEWLREHV